MAVRMSSFTRPPIRSRIAFFLGSLLWLPVGIAVLGLVRGLELPENPGDWPAMARSLIVTVPCGLPLALACRQLWRQGYRRAAWAAMAVLGPVTVAAALFAGLLGPAAIALYAVALSLPAWIAAGVLRRRR